MINPYQQMILKLHEIGAVKFGQFTLKSGMHSPIYLDLRLIVSYPDLLLDIAKAMWSKIHYLSFDLICGVPYTALPIATAISLTYQQPMVMRRKEVKDYGTKKTIEGHFHPGQCCLIIEDLITTGSSIFETINPLQNELLTIRDVAVLIDREQGGDQQLQKKGYALHSVMTLSDLLKVLEFENKINHETSIAVQEFVNSHQA